MEITSKTKLKDILNTEKDIKPKFDDLNKMQSKISDRCEMLNTEMQSGNGLSQSIIIDGKTPYYNEASDINSKYTNINESINTLTTRIINLSYDRERNELTQLKTILEGEISNCEDRISDLNRDFNLATSYGVGDALASINIAYYGPLGSITQEQQKLKKLKEDKRIDEINKRLSKLPNDISWSSYSDAANAGYCNIMTEEEFFRHHARGNSVDEYKDYQDYLNKMHDKYIGKSEIDSNKSKWKREEVITNPGDTSKLYSYTNEKGETTYIVTDSNDRTLYYYKNENGNTTFYDETNTKITKENAESIKKGNYNYNSITNQISSAAKNDESSSSSKKLSSKQIEKKQNNWNPLGPVSDGSGTYKWELEDEKASNKRYIVYTDKDKNIKYYQDTEGNYYDKNGNPTTEKEVLQYITCK